MPFPKGFASPPGIKPRIVYLYSFLHIASKYLYTLVVTTVTYLGDKRGKSATFTRSGASVPLCGGFAVSGGSFQLLIHESCELMQKYKAIIFSLVEQLRNSLELELCKLFSSLVTAQIWIPLKCCGRVWNGHISQLKEFNMVLKPYQRLLHNYTKMPATSYFSSRANINFWGWGCAAFFPEKSITSVYAEIVASPCGIAQVHHVYPLCLSKSVKRPRKQNAGIFTLNIYHWGHFDSYSTNNLDPLLTFLQITEGH